MGVPDPEHGAVGEGGRERGQDRGGPDSDGPAEDGDRSVYKSGP